ncbi:MAG TPA: glycoside hydrolase family 130 protein [Candidatus Limnocylindria bacterium]
MALDIARRVTSEPLLRPSDVHPSHPELEVVSVLNPAAARVGDEIVLLLRVAERPVRRDPPAGALTLDLSGAHPTLMPLGRGRGADDVVPITLIDGDATERLQVVYLPKDLPGLDLRDPRGITFTHPTTHRRTIFLTQFSHLRMARSRDGLSFEVDDIPAVYPHGQLEEYGCEDPRATCVGGEWHVTYVSVSRVGITTSLLTTRDFTRFTRRGVIFPPDQKDVALFPEKWRGGYMALTRPMPSSFDHVLGIWIACADPDLPFGRHEPLVMPRTGKWDERQTGASTTPFRTSCGWLEIYHGVDTDHRYTLGAVLLDGDDPTRVVARSPEPILMPELPFEMEGLFGNVVYSCGHVPLDDDGRRIRVYYGAADSCVAAADFDVSEIIATLERV